jgi:putative ABC transport system permease protein
MLFNAFRFIKYDKAKSLGALLGIVISTFLVGQQVGIFLFLTGQMKKLTMFNEQYIWVTDNKTNNVTNLGDLDMRIGRNLYSVQGVETAHPIYVTGATVQFPEGKASGVKVIGLESPSFAGAPTERIIEGKAEDLLPEGAVSVDVFNEGAFPVANVGTAFELNGRKAYIAAKTLAMNGFDGTYVFTTIDRARSLSKASSDVASAFLVTARPGVERDSVVNAINRTIFGVRAWKGEDLSDATVKYFLANTGIAMSVGTLITFAFIAGFFIIGLILYSAAVDRIRDYGTMKAIGATNGYISRLIYTQAFIFAVCGFSFGFLLLKGFQKGISNAGIFFTYPLWFMPLFFLMIAGISVGGATFAVRRITSVEPAQVFKG